LATILSVLIVVAGVRTLVDRQSASVGASATTAVPSLIGAGLGDARDRLVARDLAIGRIDTVPMPGQPANVVVYQDPPAGTQVAPGTAIDIVLRTTP
jgi:beta-lactam-binding protein with PASTA domain